MSTLPSRSRVAWCHKRGVLMLPVLLQVGAAVCAMTTRDETEKAAMPIIKAVTTGSRILGLRTLILLMLTSHVVTKFLTKGSVH